MDTNCVNFPIEQRFWKSNGERNLALSTAEYEQSFSLAQKAEMAKETLALRLDKFSKVSKYTGRHSKHEA